MLGVEVMDEVVRLACRQHAEWRSVVGWDRVIWVERYTVDGWRVFGLLDVEGSLMCW